MEADINHVTNYSVREGISSLMLNPTRILACSSPIQYQGAGIGIVLLVVKNHLYPIPDQYQHSACKDTIGNQELTENIYYQEHMTG